MAKIGCKQEHSYAINYFLEHAAEDLQVPASWNLKSIIFHKRKKRKLSWDHLHKITIQDLQKDFFHLKTAQVSTTVYNHSSG
jgi:hypothetical protein